MNHEAQGQKPPYEKEFFTGDVIKQLEKGYGSTRNYVPVELCRKLAFEITKRDEESHFTPAGIGTGEQHQVNRDIRRDRLYWWDLNFLSPVQKEYLVLLEELRLVLAAHFRAPLTEMEIFFSIYPEGGFYKRHYDNFEGRSRRLFTTVLYLNEDWTPEDGGHLKIWPNPIHGQTHRKPQLLEPRFGSLAFFITPETPHEVLPTRKERKSIVCWMGSRLDPLKIS